MNEFETIMTIGFGAGIAAVAIVCIIKAYVLIKNRKNLVPLKKAPPLFFVNKVAWIIAIFLFSDGFTKYAFVLQRGSIFAPDALRTALYVAFLVLLALYLLTANMVVLKGKNFTVFTSLIFALIFIVSGLLLRREFIRAAHFPSVEQSAIIDIPFHGTWTAIGAGATGATNHHDRIESQRYAIDFARIGEDGRLFTGEGITSRESHTWGAEVISPVFGTVVLALDGFRDDDSRDELAGNHVIIQFDDSLYVALAHFMNGTVRVQSGDLVHPGDTIALVGNSGNSDFPHLHIHVQTTPYYDLQTTQTLPFRFREGEVKRFLRWRTMENISLLSNDKIRRK